jgi:hypothetical protein
MNSDFQSTGADAQWQITERRGGRRADLRSGWIAEHLPRKLGIGNLMRQTRQNSEGRAVSHSRAETPSRPTPESVTIADSMVLVIGVAVVLTLPWYNGWVQTPQPVIWPRWIIEICETRGESFGRCAAPRRLTVPSIR